MSVHPSLRQLRRVAAVASIAATSAIVVIWGPSPAQGASSFAADCSGLPMEVAVGADAPATAAPGASVPLTDLSVDITDPTSNPWGIDAIQSGYLKLAGVTAPVVLGTTPIDASSPVVAWDIPSASTTAPATAGPFDLVVEYIDFTAEAFGTSFTIRCTPDSSPAPAFASVDVATPTTTTSTTSTPGSAIAVTSPVTGSMRIGGVDGAAFSGVTFNGTLDEAQGTLAGTMSFPRAKATSNVGDLVVKTDQQIIQVGAGEAELHDDGTATWHATYQIRMYSLQLGDAPATEFGASCTLGPIEVDATGTWDPATNALDVAQENFEIPRLTDPDACGSYTGTFNSTVAGFDTAVEFGLVLVEGTTATTTTTEPGTSSTEEPGSETAPTGPPAGAAVPVEGAASYTG